MNIQGLLKQAQQMQRDMSKVETELKEKIYEKTIGGGAVKVVANGAMKLVDLQLDDSLLKEDRTEIQEMIMAAVNEVLAEAVEDKDSAMNELTAGIKLPGGF